MKAEIFGLTFVKSDSVQRHFMCQQSCNQLLCTKILHLVTTVTKNDDTDG